MIHRAFDWLSPSVTQHVALALLHFLWQGTLVAIVLAVILRLLRDRVSADTTDPVDHSSPAPTNTRADLRYAIACFGLLVMCALPLVNLLVIEPTADTAPGPDSAAEASGVFFEASGEHGDPIAAADMSSAQSTIVEPAITTDTSGQDALLGTEPDEQPAVASPLAPRARPLVLQWFFWTWLAGVALLSTWHLAGWMLSQEYRRGGATPPDDVLALVGKIARRLRIHRAVVVRQTLKATTPMVIGWIKPALVFPASVLTGLSPRELEAVLAHELAHVRRHDYLVNLIQTVVETLLFYHPAVWWLSSRIRSEREFCADDLAMRVCQRRDVYARSLVALAEIVRIPSPRAVAATGGGFLARIRRIMHLPDQRSTSPRLARRSALVAVMATVCLGVVLMAVARSQPANDRRLSGDADVTTDAESTIESSQDGEVPEPEHIEAADTAGNQHAAADDSKQEPNTQADSTPLVWPDRLSGEVHDHEGKPIEGADVTLKIITHMRDATNFAERTLKTVQAITDADGRYEISTEGFPTPTHRPLSVEVAATAAEHASWGDSVFLNAKKHEVPKQLPTLRLPRGRVVMGRCVGVDGQPIADAAILGSSSLTRRGVWRLRHPATDANGRFRVVAPAGSDVVLWFLSESVGYKRVEVRPYDAPLVVVMERGTSLVGQAVSLTGDPIAGTVVVLQRTEPAPKRSYAVLIRLAAKTDEQGRFRLPPARGVFACFLAQATRADQSIDNPNIFADRAALPFSPIAVSLDGLQAEREITLREARTADVSGTVRFADGRPAKGGTIELNMHVPGSKYGMHLQQTTAASDGSYSFSVPVPIREISILAHGFGRWIEPSDDAPGRHQDSYIHFEEFSEEVSGADYVLQ